MNTNNLFQKLRKSTIVFNRHPSDEEPVLNKKMKRARSRFNLQCPRPATLAVCLTSGIFNNLFGETRLANFRGTNDASAGTSCRAVSSVSQNAFLVASASASPLFSYLGVCLTSLLLPTPSNLGCLLDLCDLINPFGEMRLAHFQRANDASAGTSCRAVISVSQNAFSVASASTSPRTATLMSA